MAQTPKLIVTGQEARKRLQAGVDKLAEAVVSTLGPRGANVALDRPWGVVDIIHDGVSVAKEVVLEDPIENMGAKLVRQAAEKTNDQAGDGTTTATLLAQQVVDKGNKAIEEGTNQIFLKRGIDKAKALVSKALTEMATPVKKSDWIKVATISAQDKTIGEKIAEALEMVGEDGLIETDEGASSEIEVEHSEGMELDKGYTSNYFATNGETMECVLEKPFILITDARLSSSTPLLEILKKVNGAGKPLLIIADNIDGEALQTLLINKLKGALQVCVVRTPTFGDDGKSVLEDIAIVTGGTVISSDKGFKLEETSLEQCGIAQRVIVDGSKTKIIGGEGTKEEIEERVRQLKLQSSKGNEFQKTRINERIARLTKGVAIIRVGASTEVELNDKKERVKDAVGATKAAIEEGIIAGSGISLIFASKVLDDVKCDTVDEERGVDIVKEALAEPLRHQIRNSGLNPEKMLKKIMDINDPDMSFNSETLKVCSMSKAGIIDPVKVARLAVENGLSVASMILTTKCDITDLPKKDETTR